MGTPRTTCWQPRMVMGGARNLGMRCDLFESPRNELDIHSEPTPPRVTTAVMHNAVAQRCHVSKREVRAVQITTGREVE